MAEFSTTKITPTDDVQIPSVNGQVAGYQENDELKSYVLGTIPTDVSGHTADITGIRGTSLDYDPDSTTYTKGATCILNHIVYRAKQLIPSPAGAFDSSKWEEVSLHEIARKVATNADNIEANTEAITSLMPTPTSLLTTGITFYNGASLDTGGEGGGYYRFGNFVYFTLWINDAPNGRKKVAQLPFTFKECSVVNCIDWLEDNTTFYAMLYKDGSLYINNTKTVRRVYVTGFGLLA